MTSRVTNLLLADIGLPMVALYVPAAWLALLPIICIEAIYGARRYKLQFGRAFFAEAAANCFSTIIGIPLTWLGIVLIQILIVPSGVGPAWLWPGSRWPSIAAALSALTVVFYFMSVVTEGFIVRCFFRQLPRQALRSWMVRANGISYALLLVLFVVGLSAGAIDFPDGSR